MMSGNNQSGSVGMALRGFYVASLVSSACFGQTQRTENQNGLLNELQVGTEKQATTVVQPGGVALESLVDPELYHVGPSDIIAVNIWTSHPLSFSLTVTPEGTLIVPTVGEIRVAELTLAEAKVRIVAEIASKYISGKATVTLVKPRPIIVNVIGYVLNPGLQTLSAADRTNRALEIANTPRIPQVTTNSPPLPERVSNRNIVVEHHDGSRERVDLTYSLASRDQKRNPYLREGDVVVVPERDPRTNVFGIYGEVNVPARYEYVYGDSVLEALHFAQGFTPLAVADSVLFTRMNAEGGVLFDRTINLDAIEKHLSPNIAMQPGDRIVVKARPDLQRDYKVTVSGEVRFGGFFAISRNRTKLSEIIRRAGGFTSFASIKSAELIRQSILPAELQLEQLESLRGGVAPDDSSYYYLENTLRIQKEMVNVDFDKLFIQGDSTQDAILQDNDRIIVPSTKQTIYVFGQVVSTGHVPYVSGERAEYYIRKAGGFTDRARSGEVTIVKAKTRQWLSPSETVIEEGDYVWVPKEVERPFSYYMSIIGQTATIVSVAVSIVLLVIQLKK